MKFLGVLLGVGLIFFFLIHHKKNQLEFASEKLICLKALNSGWTDWDYAFLGVVRPDLGEHPRAIMPDWYQQEINQATEND